MVIRTYRLLISSFIVFILAGFVNVQIAKTQEISSAYTTLDLEKCHRLTQTELGLPELTKQDIAEGIGGAAWSCVGYNNFIVYVAADDLRMFISFGQEATKEINFRATFSKFNYLGKTIEWRVRKVNKQWVPFATILRWHTEWGERSEIKGQTLVVTKIEEGNICQIAYIDALTVPNANELAREVADNIALNFNCESDEIYRIPSE